ncbi:MULTISPECIES: serine protease [Prauserella salsuginis group]|uniref:Serine protease n=2 Tax=Prauserella salsuginis group TaxID=2893672 RepID=A0A839XVR4_9PSEU|nr:MULTISPECIES: serine protease [Prauserella salsuginis group]MBB3664106.1 hypothetical protein [Prauserella sediminis]MCR3721560.1 hypothetical protein [Prauserella flava]MCR3734252.1 hypothetical protein [Prauserella salsuginis]
MRRLVSRRTAWLAGGVFSAALIASSGTVAAAPAVSAWAPADSATVHPGVMTYTEGAQCTANFVFRDGVDVFLGQAAHCSGTGGSTATDGCESGSLPLGTKVEIEGASEPGTMVYNSWLAMQESGETDPDTCAYNDFALVRIDPADVDRVNPSVPFWGGPAGLNTEGTAAGDTVLSYGNSSLRGGITQLSPKQGTSIGDSGGGWSHQAYTATPGIPGDSGSAFLDDQGQALGVLSTLTVLPTAGSNGVGDLGRELAYLQNHSAYGGVELVAGTEPFRGPLP